MIQPYLDFAFNMSGYVLRLVSSPLFYVPAACIFFCVVIAIIRYIVSGGVHDV